MGGWSDNRNVQTTTKLAVAWSFGFTWFETGVWSRSRTTLIL